jgi:hypothetical protein
MKKIPIAFIVGPNDKVFDKGCFGLGHLLDFAFYSSKPCSGEIDTLPASFPEFSSSSEGMEADSEHAGLV